MVDTKVETVSRLTQWKIENFGPGSIKISDPFKVGIWNWYLGLEKTRYTVQLSPDLSKQSKEEAPFARFVLQLSITGSTTRKSYISPVYERVFRACDDFVWPVDCTFQGRLVIDVEFLDLNIFPLNGGIALSAWQSAGTVQSTAMETTLKCLSRMLNDAIHSDVTINTSNGTLRAHKAILAASSPVFQSMFKHDLKEKESSTIHIEDMSLESCSALLAHLYGTIKHEDFWKHRIPLLGAANKYGITDLKDACEDSLLEDISTQNVLERLQEAWLYQLPKLKKGCLSYLFDFGKIYDVREEIGDFFKHADRELMVEIFQEVLTVGKLI